MNNMLFIDALDDVLAKSNLGFVTTIIDVVIIFIIAKLLNVIIKRVGKLLVKRRTQKIGEMRAKRFETAQTAIVSGLKYLIYFVAIAITLGAVGLESAMTSMLAAAGIGGLALSIGAQSFLKDLTAGLFMLFEGQVVVGDFIEAGGVTGTVEAVSIRTTSIRGVGGELYIVPNGEIGTIKNCSDSNYMTVVDVGIAYEADSDRALDLMMDEARKYTDELGGVVSGAPIRSGVVSLAESAVVLRVCIFVRPPAHIGAQRELTRRVKYRFDEEGIEISYNKVVVFQKKES